MLRRHQIFNVIIEFWHGKGDSSTPRRGELRRLLAKQGKRMSRQTLQEHLLALEKDGFIQLNEGVIVLLRKMPLTEPCTCEPA